MKLSTFLTEIQIYTGLRIESEDAIIDLERGSCSYFNILFKEERIVKLIEKIPDSDISESDRKNLIACVDNTIDAIVAFPDKIILRVYRERTDGSRPDYKDLPEQRVIEPIKWKE